MKHTPFQSIYRPDFEVVEERRGRVSFYPHTEQLPLLLRALNLEFYGALPDYIARVDKRGSGFHKYLLKQAAFLFSSAFNRARTDQLRLFHLPTADVVYQIALVQQISEHHPLGLFHRFRFFGRDGFFPEIRLSGRRLAFADHVLQRFSARVPNNVGEDLALFLLIFFTTPTISMPLGKGLAFMVRHMDSVLAFPYKEQDGEFFILTCLTVNEMNSLELPLPPHTLNLHYGADFTRPKLRNWIPMKLAKDILERWQKKIPFPPPQAITPDPNWRWKKVALFLKDMALQTGQKPDLRLCFLDHLPGPVTMEFATGMPDTGYDELAEFKKAAPQHDWDAAFALLDSLDAKKAGSDQNDAAEIR
ncbi:MAG TPA: hypothetical protein VHZ30_00305 [Verrucomicrobiae bacterium]|jgi:hypothetical protein|nr:hypothetical protein [Verrucomicrobiae bacterium]